MVSLSFKPWALWFFCFVVVSGESWGGITKGQEKKSKEKADREIWREREAGIYCAVSNFLRMVRG